MALRLKTFLLVALFMQPGIPAAHAVEVGVAAAVNSEAFGTPPGGARATKVLGANVIYKERIETGASGLVQVLLVDGSSFTVGANSDLVIDEFVYDPNSGSGKLVATFSKGVARFVGGKLSKKRGGVRVNTPVGTIGIRGGIANINLASSPSIFSLLFGKDLTFTGPNGLKKRIHQAGYTLYFGPNGQPKIRRTTQGDLAAVQAGLSQGRQNGGTGTPPTNARITGSGFPNINSRLSNINSLPPSKPSPVQSTLLKDVEKKGIQTQSATQSNLRKVLEKNSQQIEPGDPYYTPGL